jgi:hypothetical protein
VTDGSYMSVILSKTVSYQETLGALSKSLKDSQSWYLVLECEGAGGVPTEDTARLPCQTCLV